VNGLNEALGVILLGSVEIETELLLENGAKRMGFSLSLTPPPPHARNQTACFCCLLRLQRL
jgi:hypothetical protein